MVTIHWSVHILRRAFSPRIWDIVIVKCIDCPFSVNKVLRLCMNVNVLFFFSMIILIHNKRFSVGEVFFLFYGAWAPFRSYFVFPLDAFTANQGSNSIKCKCRYAVCFESQTNTQIYTHVHRFRRITINRWAKGWNEKKKKQTKYT